MGYDYEDIIREIEEQKQKNKKILTFDMQEIV